MKLRIDNYDVEIKAKGIYGERNNKKDAMSFLNLLSIVFDEAGRYNEQRHDGYDMGYRKVAHEIYKILDAEGLYKEV